eukprot:jgi/Undpi1/8413/HiC_scaffold_25.g10881.m1
MSYEVEAGVGGGGAGGDGVDGGDRRGYFTPLWQTKGAQSFGGGLLQAVPGAWMAGDVPGSNFVESEGFVPLRKARSEAITNMQTRFSFNSKAAKETYAEAWDKRDPWRMLKKNVSFAARQEEGLDNQARGLDAKAVVVVDPFSSGAVLAKRVIAEGYRCIRLFSVIDSPMAKLIQEGTVLEFDATFQFDARSLDPEGAIADLIEDLRQLPWEIAAIMPGAETGVELADILSNRLGTASNGEDLSLCRRNKHLMAEQVRSHGVRAVRQVLAHSWDDCEAFLLDWNPNPFKAVVKPLESAGSDDVYLCHSVEDVKEAFSIIDGKVNGIGGINEGALVQEYLDGTEYVVDTVSRGGVHRLCAIWEYDKRSVNGANFVYFGMKLISAKGDREREIVDYALKVLDAMGVVHGPGHMEVKYTATGPCLVEVGTRCHGGEGTWQAIADECLGYNQIDMTFNAYLDQAQWEAMPMRPMELKKAGREVFFVSRQSGMLRALPGLKEIKEFQSFRRHEVAAKPRDFVQKTIDCFTRPGSAQLVHEDEDIVVREYERVRSLEKRGLFDFELVCPTPLPTAAVVVVDPFSSGSILAARVLHYKLRLVMVFSEMDSSMASLVQQGTSLTPDMTIQHDDLHEDPEIAIHQTLQSLLELPHPVIAVLAGAETGVELADKLSARMGNRNNGEDLTLARRNKYLMGEQVRSCGVRAARQSLASTVEEVGAFLDDWNPVSPWKAVVKPLDSAGSDDVFLVESRSEAEERFKFIDGKVNGLGGVNEGALVMEYLDGAEYVVDSVSRDGEHRICAIWEYDKRTVNDTNFVYFGMELRSVTSKVEQELAEYARNVLTAMGIENGPGHMEVKYTSTGPCLVEVGSRCHGGEGTWQSIADECLGYNQIDATLDAYIKPDEFEKIPMDPTAMKKKGKEVFLVSRQEGRVARVPGVDIIRGLASFRTLEMSAQPGSYLKKTVDCFTRPGAVQLVHEDAKQLQADYLTIRELEDSGLFELAPEETWTDNDTAASSNGKHASLDDRSQRCSSSSGTRTPLGGTAPASLCGGVRGPRDRSYSSNPVLV